MAVPFTQNIDLLLNQILNGKWQLLASDPGSPADGQFWINTTTNLAKMRVNGVTITLAHLGNKIHDFTAPTAALPMNAQKITGLGLATAGTDAASLANKLTDFAAPTSSLALGGQKITGLADGTAATDAATKGQVDLAANGLDAKQSVRAATTAAGTLATSFANGQTIDGITLATGDRILIKNQASAQENGIYIVAASGAPARAGDMDVWTEVPGAFTFVELGTANADTGWLSIADQGGTLNTTAINWTKFTAAATGVQKFSLTIGDNAATSFNVDHNLGSLDVQVDVVRVSDGATVYTDITRTTTNRVVVAFATAPTTNQYRVVVIG